MAIPGTWVAQESDAGLKTGDTALKYKVVLRCATYTLLEARRVIGYALYNAAFTNTSGGAFYKEAAGTNALTETTDILNSDNTTTTIYFIAFDADPEDCHEDMIDDIKTIEDALVARNTQVTQANTVTTGEIEVYAAGKITATVGTP